MALLENDPVLNVTHELEDGQVNPRCLIATPRRRDGLHQILEMQLGPQRFTVDAQNHAAERPFDHRVIARATAFRLPDRREQAGIQDIYGQLASDAARNDLIFNDVITAVDKGRSPLILTAARII